MGSPLADRLHVDMIAAMKAREKEKLSVLRMLLSAVKDAKIEKREELDDDEVLRLIMSYAKKREDAKTEAAKLGREDLVAQEAFELGVVQSYLPEQLSDEELQAMVAEAIQETDASSIRDMGRVMKLCQERAQGRADGSRISALVKSQLSG